MGILWLNLQDFTFVGEVGLQVISLIMQTMIYADTSSSPPDAYSLHLSNLQNILSTEWTRRQTNSYKQGLV